MNNKIALVTGGSRGLGKSTVLNLASKGVDSIFTYLSRGDDATRVAADVEKLGGKAVALQLDAGNVSNFGDFSERVKKTFHSHWQVNSFDFLVNNAGIGVNELFTETTEAQFDLLMNLHFKGVFFSYPNTITIDQRRRASRQRVERAGPFFSAGSFRIRSDERRYRGVDQIPGQRTGPKEDCCQLCCSWCN
jgi:NAD(P)-dependent dehydrogenase (short-subunit alcohol dehydrogenase family)